MTIKGRTNRPVLVYDVRFKMKQHLRSHEIELLMGHEKYVTKHPSVTNKDRNQCLGNGWDMNVVAQLLKHLDLGAAQKVRRTTHADHSEKHTWQEVWEVSECMTLILFMMHWDILHRPLWKSFKR